MDSDGRCHYEVNVISKTNDYLRRLVLYGGAFGQIFASKCVIKAVKDIALTFSITQYAHVQLLFRYIVAACLERLVVDVRRCVAV